MKRTIILLATAAALASCSQEGNEPDSGAATGMEVTASIEGASTRAHDAAWDNNDAIGITCTGYNGTAPTGAPAFASNVMAAYKNYKYTYASNKFSPAAGNTIWFENAYSYTFSAYYPYGGSLGSANTVNINTQTNQSAANRKTIDILYATGTASKASPSAAFTFTHKMAQLELVFNLDTAAGFPADATTYIAGAYPLLTGLKHVGTFAGDTGAVSVTGTAVTDWQPKANGGAVPTVGSDKHSFTYKLILLPQTANLGVSLKDADSQTYKLAAAISNVKLEAGKTTKVTVTVKKTGLEVTGYTINAWTATTATGVDATIQ